MNTNKPIIKTLAALVLTALAPLTSYGAITGTAHDFKAASWTGGQICIACHTPHNAKAGALHIIPLWNHAATTNTFALYTSPTNTLNASVTAQPAGASKACLSCHDGTVAVSSIGTTTGIIFASKLLGTTLADDHPVSFTYDATLALADTELVSPQTTSLVVAGIPLFGGTGQMECATCHDVHSNTHGKFLRVSNAGSALCLKCHIK